MNDTGRNIRPLVLENTMSRSREEFRPRFDSTVKLFTCGPSVYRRPHIGNYRTFLFEDVLQRYLEYQGYRVERVINFTDVEDKAIAEAKEQGMAPLEVVEPAEEQFFRDAELLRIELPDFIPRSSTSVDAAAEIIRVLLEQGIAYRHGGNIYFDPLKYEGFGRLFRLDMSRWPKKRVRFSRDTYNGLRWNLGDFILWHGYREGDPLFWDTVIGKGRPAWNVQDPAMIVKHLGPEIDIHCGGIDNIYRHHDYNIAVVESYSDSHFVNYWLHGEHLIVNGKKMSKSSGTVLYPDDLHAQGYAPGEIRFALIHGHYRKKLNHSEKRMERVVGLLREMRESAARVLGAVPVGSVGTGGAVSRMAADGAGVPAGVRSEAAAGGAGGSGGDPAGALLDAFEAGMSEDLQVDRAVEGLGKALKALERRARSGDLPSGSLPAVQEALVRIDGVLQVGLADGAGG